MIKHLKTFFYPVPLTYTYNHSKEFVIEKLSEIFKKKATLFTSNDMTGEFLKMTLLKYIQSVLVIRSVVSLVLLLLVKLQKQVK